MGIHIFKVALEGNEGIWRRIAMRDDQTLGELHTTVFHAFDRFDPHFYAFFVAPKTVTLTPQNAYEQAVEYTHPQAANDGMWDIPGLGQSQQPRAKNAEKTTIASLRLSPDQVLLYLFDFGDEWWHVITVEETDAAPDPAVSYPAVIAKHGKSPAQYEEYDEEEFFAFPEELATALGATEPRPLPDDVREALQGKNFVTLEEANAFLAAYMRERNQRSLNDFQGLSPVQLHHFIVSPFESPEFVTFAEAPEESLDTPIMRLFALLVEAIGEKGLKPTSTGNLPRNVVRASALTYWGEERYREHTRLGEPRTEPEFGDLHITRLVAELADLIRKYKGKFILSRDCRTVLAKVGLAGVYPRLLRAFVTRFNWGYRDMYDELPLIQHTFLFTLYLLHHFGDQWRKTAFYEDAFLQAFPQLLDEVTPRPYSTPEATVRHAYTLRALDHFTVFLGFAEMRATGPQWDAPREIRALSLLRSAVHFAPIG